MDWSSPAFVVAGALIGGLLNGLTGFGTGLTALPLWLQVLEPVVAAQLVSVASITGHLGALPALWRDSDWCELGPMLGAGLIGVPIGLCILPLIKVDVFKMSVASCSSAIARSCWVRLAICIFVAPARPRKC
jgi:uncharacterized protein